MVFARFHVIQDDPIELKSNEFEKRKVSLEFPLPFDAVSDGILNFNISAENVQSVVNTVVIINSIEIKRYSFSNQSVHTLQEVLSPSSNLHATGNRVEFEIIDTLLSETGILAISDIVLWFNVLNQ
jgi:hypothetical protein